MPEVTVPPVTVPPVTVPVTLPTTAPPVAVTVPKVRVPTIRPTTTTTQRTTTVAPAPASSSGCMANAPKSYAQMQSCWSNLVAQYPWPSTAKVWSVMYCESKGNPWAHNPSGATGLMQIMGGPYDPAQNMAAAWSMSRHGTYWRPWTCQ